MIGHVSKLLTATLSFTVAALTAAAQFSGVEIAITAPAYAVSYTGYAVYQVTVQNNTPNDRDVLIVVDEDSYWGPRLSSVRLRLEAPANSVVRTKLAQPPLQMGSSARVWIDGRMQDDSLFIPHLAHGYDPHSSHSSWRGSGGSDVLPPIAVSNALSSVFKEALGDDTFATTSSSGVVFRSKQVQFVEHAPNGWPTSWQGWSRCAMALLHEREFESMRPASQASLRAWVRTGGTLVIIGDSFPSALADSAVPSEEEFMLKEGFGTIVRVSDFTATDQADENEYRERVHSLLRTIQTNIYRTDPSLNGTGAERAMPLAPDNEVPARTLLAIVTFFALLVGPVNLVVLAKLRRRTLLFLTVPALGTIFATGIFIIGFIQGGIRPRAATASVTVLDQVSGFATTRAHRGYYAPLTPGDGLRFESDTLIHPLFNADRYGYSFEDRPLSIDLSNGQHLRAGWIRPRVPEHFLLSKHQSERNRVVVEPTQDGGFRALNGLGVNIRAFTYADTQGNVFRSEAINAGQSVLLEPDPTTDAASVIDRSEALELAARGAERGAGALARSFIDEDVEWVPRDGYIAIIEEDPFIELGLEGVREHVQHAVIIGLLEGS